MESGVPRPAGRDAGPNGLGTGRTERVEGEGGFESLLLPMFENTIRCGAESKILQ